MCVPGKLKKTQEEANIARMEIEEKKEREKKASLDKKELVSGLNQSVPSIHRRSQPLLYKPALRSYLSPTHLPLLSLAHTYPYSLIHTLTLTLFHTLTLTLSLSHTHPYSYQEKELAQLREKRNEEISIMDEQIK